MIAKNRRHFFQEDFFEKIETEEQAYWLGFICADGHINNRGNTVGITLNKEDKEHLLKFLTCLKSNKIKVENTTGRFDKEHPITEKARISLYSKKMHSDLVNLGLTITKSKDLKELSINSLLVHHFIRGYFDGDGCVFDSYIKGRKDKPCYSPGFTFVGTKEFLNFINNSLPFQVKNLTHDKRTDNSYTLYIRSQKRFKIVEEYLYKDATIFLDRKKEKCQFIKAKLEEGSTTSSLERTLK